MSVVERAGPMPAPRSDPGRGTRPRRRRRAAGRVSGRPGSRADRGADGGATGRATGRRLDRRQFAALVATGVIVATVLTGLTRSGSPNLLANGGFEHGTTGWFATAGRLEQVTPGHGGRWSARVTNTGARPRTVGVDDTEPVVRRSVAGHTYRADAYVRSGTAGRTVTIRLRETADGVQVDGREVTVTLRDSGWHPVSVDHTAVRAGTALEVAVLAPALAAGGSILLDDVKVVDRGDGNGDGDGDGDVLLAPAPGPDPSTAPAVRAAAAPQPGRTEPAAGTAADLGTGYRRSTIGSAVSTGPGPDRSARGSNGSSTDRSPGSGTGRPGRTSSPEPEPPPAGPTAPGAPAGWRLVWSDEFGDGVDPADWRVDDLSTYGDGNRELACLMDRPANIFTSGGALTLRARRESPRLRCGSDARFPGGRSFSSAMIRSTRSWTYGRFEIRARLPLEAGRSKGLWPAFWLRPVGGGTGELDVLEAIGSAPGDDTSRNIHQTIWYDYSGTHPKQSKTYVAGFDASDGWHTYATEWEPGRLRWYVDGKLTYERTTATTSWLRSAFAKPFYVRLNLAVGGSWPGSPHAATRFPADYRIDYLRVYQR